MISIVFIGHSGLGFGFGWYKRRRLWKLFVYVFDTSAAQMHSTFQVYSDSIVLPGCDSRLWIVSRTCYFTAATNNVQVH